MSGIRSITPPEARDPLEDRPLDPDRKRPPRRRPKSTDDDDTVQVEPHQLDLEA